MARLKLFTHQNQLFCQTEILKTTPGLPRHRDNGTLSSKISPFRLKIDTTIAKISLRAFDWLSNGVQKLNFGLQNRRQLLLHFFKKIPTRTKNLSSWQNFEKTKIEKSQIPLQKCQKIIKLTPANEMFTIKIMFKKLKTKNKL